MNAHTLIKNVEKLVNPMSVGTLHFLQQLNKYMPKPVQRFLVTSSSKKTPIMGFVVEPYSYFLCYEIVDIKQAETLLPTGFILEKISIFDDDEPKYYCVFGCFTAHTSAFWGSRVEFYIIAKDTKTGLASWIIVDYDSNTISYDKQNGLKSPNASKAVMTTTFGGDLVVEMPRDDGTRTVSFTSSLKHGKHKLLGQKLWLEGNLSIGYGKHLSKNDADIFSLRFDPGEVATALSIPASDFSLIKNSWYPGLFDAMPKQLVCFPYAQHFIADSPGAASKIMNEQQLIHSLQEIDFEKIVPFSSEAVVRAFLLGSLLSGLFTTALLLLHFLR